MADLYHVKIFSTLQKNDNIYNFDLEQTGVGAAGTPENELNEFFKMVILPPLLPLHADTMVFECIETQKFDPVKGVAEQLPLEENNVGTRNGQALPGQCSLVMQLFSDTLDVTPNNRGRDFQFGAVEGDQVDGRWFQAYMDAWRNFYEAFILVPTITENNWQFLIGVFSPTLKKLIPVVDYFFPYSEAKPKALVRTQRRRQPTNPCDLFVGATTPP